MRLEELLKQTADNYEDSKFTPILKNLQANIFKHHLKRKAVYALITFKENNFEEQNEEAKKELTKWLRKLDVTNAYKQFEDLRNATTQRKDLKKAINLFAGLKKAFKQIEKLKKNIKEQKTDELDIRQIERLKEESNKIQGIKKESNKIEKQFENLKNTIIQIQDSNLIKPKKQIAEPIKNLIGVVQSIGKENFFEATILVEKFEKAIELVEKYVKEIYRLKIKIEDLKLASKPFEDESNILEEEKNKIDQQIDQQVEELKKFAKAQIADLHNKNKVNKKEIEHLENEKKQHQKQIKELEKANNPSEKEKENLRKLNNQIADYKNRIRQNEIKEEDINKEIKKFEDIRKEILDNKNHIEILEKAKNQIGHQIKKLTQAIKVVEVIKEEAKNLENYILEIEQLKSEIEKLTEETLINLKNELIKKIEEKVLINKNELIHKLEKIKIQQPKDFKEEIKEIEESISSSRIICFHLSYEGYRYFGKTGSQIPEGETPTFKEGLESTVFFKENSSEIEKNYNTEKKKIHALLLIADASQNISEIKEEVDKAIRQFGSAFFETAYLAAPGDEKTNREWFGFKDGISNPRFFPNEEVKTRSDYEEPSNLNLVLRACKGGPPYSCGSFVTFLKFEQNVDAFNDTCKDLASEIYDVNDPNDDKKDFAGALLIGRHKDGTPITLSSTPNSGINLKAFNYSKDPEGFNCPLHAHIRKANPREGNENRQIVRRGMIYGKGASKKGLLFMSYQKDLGSQFEYLINQRMTRYSYGGRNTGSDPLMSKNPKYRKYFKSWGSGSGQPILIRNRSLITFKGGLYFFAPSISYIRYLGRF